MTARDVARSRWICCITVAFRQKLRGLLVFLCLRLLEFWLSKGLWLQTFGQLLFLILRWSRILQAPCTTLDLDLRSTGLVDTELCTRFNPTFRLALDTRIS